MIPTTQNDKNDDGRYLNLLRTEMGLCYAGSEPILQFSAALEEKARCIVRQKTQAGGDEVSEHVAMVMVDLETVMRTMRDLAFQIAGPIDKFLYVPPRRVVSSRVWSCVRRNSAHGERPRGGEEQEQGQQQQQAESRRRNI
jgi:hypothetical protein